MVKNLPSVQETQVPGSGGSPRGGNGNSLQYFCLENPVDRGAWWATIHGVTKSQTQLGNLSTHALLLGDLVFVEMSREFHKRAANTKPPGTKQHLEQSQGKVQPRLIGNQKPDFSWL